MCCQPLLTAILEMAESIRISTARIVEWLCISSLLNSEV